MCKSVRGEFAKLVYNKILNIEKYVFEDMKLFYSHGALRSDSCWEFEDFNDFPNLSFAWN